MLFSFNYTEGFLVKLLHSCVFMSLSIRSDIQTAAICRANHAGFHTAENTGCQVIKFHNSPSFSKQLIFKEFDLRTKEIKERD